MTYLHIEIQECQTPKRTGDVCGDAWSCVRNERSTTLICCDGIGSGIKANVAATMTLARIEELFRRGCSLREAVGNVANTMNAAKLTDLPYTAFCVARILSDGETTVLTYEMPGPILVGRRLATVLPQRVLSIDKALIQESCCILEPGEAVALVSDGITQAGLGTSLRDGWTTQGVCRFINDRTSQGSTRASLTGSIVRQAAQLSRDPRGLTHGDDCTALLAECRQGSVVNILTGPPNRKQDDGPVARAFTRLEGRKIVCGGTTAKIIAHQLKRRLAVAADTTSMVAPPDYDLEGVDLATEGAVTLNQAYNILDEDPARYEHNTGVSQLCEMLRSADRVRFYVGGALNEAHGDISFQQRGILYRGTIVSLLAGKLAQRGKLVTVEPTGSLLEGHRDGAPAGIGRASPARVP